MLLWKEIQDVKAEIIIIFFVITQVLLNRLLSNLVEKYFLRKEIVIFVLNQIDR